MWVLITNIFTNAALLVPVIGFIIVFISARDERIRSLTTMKIEVEDFYKKYNCMCWRIVYFDKIKTIFNYYFVKFFKIF